MSQNICLAQSIEELDFILKKISEPVKVVPLDLSTHLYCIYNKINYYNPIDFIKKDFHLKSISESEKLINGINFGNLNSNAIEKKYTSFIRYRFYKTYFLVELIKKINDFNKIGKIYISGWQRYTESFSEKNYFLSYLVKNILKNFNISELSPEKYVYKEKKNFKFSLEYKKKIKGKTIIISSLGYKLSRILIYAVKNNYKILIIDSNVSLIKKIIFVLLGIKFIKFKNNNEILENEIIIPNIDFKVKEIDYSKILNHKKNQELKSLNVLNAKYSAIKDFLKKNKNLSMIFSNTPLGIAGLLTEGASINSIPSICINHGTISKSFDRFDEIYKKNNAEKNFGGKAKYFSIQSKIMKDSLATHKIKGKTIETGNILFQEENRKKKYFIMYAANIKNLDSLQFLGDEMFYEFVDNLYLFEKLSVKNGFNFLVKLHPDQKKHLVLLKKIFKKLKFTISDLDKNLQKTLLTISYSSTVIEDSLYSGVPVILFDKWKRYKHCDSQLNPNLKNEAIYYVVNDRDLLAAIDSIKDSSKFNFNNYIYSGKSSENIKKLFYKII